MILISIGANLAASAHSPPLATCRKAIAELDQLPNLTVRALSSWYETAPEPPSGQPSYVNAVAHLVVDHGTQIDPSVLLECLIGVERMAGRQRAARNAARTLDLDIVAVDSQVRHAPDPILPHPRAHLRAFVLVPLRDVAPGWVHPVFHRDVDSLIAALPPQPIRRLRSAC
jgi:2-amino-4-hydroxy-6-hydroxymethyldihydropteridine diphosphokinase